MSLNLGRPTGLNLKSALNKAWETRIGLIFPIIIAGLLFLVGSFFIGGRYTTSSPLSLGGSAGGVFVVDRFTGHAHYCGVSPPNLGCRPLAERE